MKLESHDLDHLRCYYDGKISEIGEKALSMMAVLFQGLHHIPSTQLEKIDWSDPYCISMSTFFPLATFDDNKLTNLVLLAHDFAVRVEVRPCNFHYLKIRFHQRKRDGDLYSRHPTIEDVLKKWRSD